MKNNDKKNFIWNIIGLTFYAFISLLLLIIVKRINGMNIAGIFTYAYSLSTLFLYISLYYNRVYQIANYNSNKEFNQFLSVRIITSIIAITLIILFSLINQFDIYKTTIIGILMLFRVCDAISDTFYGYIQEKNCLYKVGISYFLKSSIGLALFTVVDIYTNNLIISCASLVFINIVFMVLYDLTNYKELSKHAPIKLDFSNYKLIIKEAFPIFAFSFCNIYLANSQKYVINYYVSNDLQTIFGILIMPATFLSLVGSYLIMPFLNKINNLYKAKNIKDLFSLCNKIIGGLFIIGAIGVIACYFIGIPILNIIYGINLYDYKIGLELIIIGSIFAAGSMIISNILVVFNDNTSQIFIYLIGSIISTLLSVIFVNNYGLNGAIYSYILVYILVFSLYIYRYLRDIKIHKQLGE